ncbi:MAG: type I methionyl aminopeptidase [Holosporales bacterium]|jgi:methionyl aminopeptidase|nr:type I methionyl aminopeptidase [Holosporales bacterium]
MSKIKRHKKAHFAKMREAGHLAANVLNYLELSIVEGVTTGELDRLCHDFIIKHNAIPATLGYEGYPKSSCISLNNVVCHGIPGNEVLRNGDILNIDITVILDGWHGDTSRMYTVGTITPHASKLIQVAYNALMKSIELVGPGVHWGNVGHFIETFVASNGFSVVKDYCGHGIGQIFHDLPQIDHFGTPGEGFIIREGMFFTIEPMVNAGLEETVLLDDGWTVVTFDNSLSAQFEHSIGITEHGAEIFTKSG